MSKKLNIIHEVRATFDVGKYPPWDIPAPKLQKLLDEGPNNYRKHVTFEHIKLRTGFLMHRYELRVTVYWVETSEDT